MTSAFAVTHFSVKGFDLMSWYEGDMAHELSVFLKYGYFGGTSMQPLCCTPEIRRQSERYLNGIGCGLPCPLPVHAESTPCLTTRARSPLEV